MGNYSRILSVPVPAGILATLGLAAANLELKVPGVGNCEITASFPLTVDTQAKKLAAWTFSPSSFKATRK